MLAAERRKEREAAAAREREDAATMEWWTQLQERLFNLTHNRRERELREMEIYLAEMGDKLGGGDMPGWIARLEGAWRADINKRAAERNPTFAGREVEAFQSRFLTRAPGREQAPLTIVDQEKIIGKLEAGLGAALEKQAKEIGVEVGKHLKVVEIN